MLHEFGDLVRADGEAAPIDDGVGGVDDVKQVAGGGELCRAVDDSRVRRVGVGAGCAKAGTCVLPGPAAGM